MKISWLLHLHQPPTQLPIVVRDVSASCYRPLLGLLLDNSNLKLTLNVTTSLIEWWQKEGGEDLIETLRTLVARGQVELTGTGAYHPILTLIPETEAIRQIRLQEQALDVILSSAKDLSPSASSASQNNDSSRGVQNDVLSGFFSPELAISDHLLTILDGLGYNWAIADEVAALNQPHFLQVGSHKTKVVIRDRGASLAVAFGHTQTLHTFTNMVEQYSRFKEHLVLVMDGETFGHHWPGSLGFLADLIKEGSYEFCTISRLTGVETHCNASLRGLSPTSPEISDVPERVTWEPIDHLNESTWGTSDEDLARGELYPRWKLPGNEIHSLQWQLVELAIKRVGARSLLDRALHSDQFWWASHNPYWNLEMVQKGAAMLRDAAGTPEAEELYNKILTRGRALYGEQVVTG